MYMLIYCLSLQWKTLSAQITSGLHSNVQSSCNVQVSSRVRVRVRKNDYIVQSNFVHCTYLHTLPTSFVRWQMSRLVSDFVPVHLRHWLSAAPDCLPSVTELSGLPDLVTSAHSVAVFRSRLKTHLFNISYPSPLWLYSACAVTLSCFGHYNRSSLL